MKSIKQSRLDRLARRKLQQKKEIEAEKKLTKKQKLDRFNKILKEAEKQCIRAGEIKCQHGVPFSGFECFVCDQDRISDRLREEWSPTPTYKANVYIDDPDETRLHISIKTRYPTQKIISMQENGFWYLFDGKPVFMLPGNIKVVQLNDKVQNHDYIDPADLPDPTNRGKIRFSEG